MKRTSLSAGLIIAHLLEHSSVDCKVFPCIAPLDSDLPYVVYGRTAVCTIPDKGMGAADTCSIEVICFDSSYNGAVDLAERVRDAIEGMTGTVQGVSLRSSVVSDSKEGWSNDAYFQNIKFTLKIN